LVRVRASHARGQRFKSSNAHHKINSMSIEEQIKLLIELQKLDSQIFRLKKELASQPVLIRNLEESFKEKEITLKRNEEEHKSLLVKHKEREGALQSKEEGIKKLQTQLYQLKTNKEYQAMEKEISSQKADVSVIEEEIIKILDRIDECIKEVARKKDILILERKGLEDQKKIIDAKTKEIEGQLQKLNSERAELSQKVEKVFLTKYERILNSKNGLAMVSVEHDACSGCNINLPPQVINEIRMQRELIFCGSCARILYIEEDAGGGQ
jgi:uncharacterized protein